MKLIWKFFKSIRLTIYLCVIYIILSLWGSFSLQIDGDLYKTIDNEVLFNWLRQTGRPAINKTSWIFLLIINIVFLGINTLVCTIDRLANIWKRVFNRNLNIQIEFLNSLKFRSEKIAEGDPEVIKNVILTQLHRKGYNTITSVPDKQQTTDNACPRIIIYADKNCFFAFAEVIVHFAFILLLLGHLITSIYGSKSIDNVAWKNYKTVIPNKTFSVLLHDINMRFYPSGQPEDFSADIGIIKDNNEVTRKVIKINYPLFYDGNVVYLTNLGYDQSANWPYAVLTVNSDPGAKFVLWAGIFFMIGLLGTFFVTYRRIWIFITSLENGQIEIKAGAWINQTGYKMDKELENII
ncbi:MAG: cytochrome c biogenesis protein ResB [bacterium]|nr:cytochrome c biogenesis protein ResB [bacterium]